MAKSILVTGGLGLIGSAVCKHFLDNGWSVVCVDNDMRQSLFGKEGSTTKNLSEESFFKSKGIEIINADIRDKKKMEKIIPNVDAIAHLAAQPSHPKSMEIPMEDFQINAFGSLQILEIARQTNRDIPIAFLSSNKVYGDNPNKFNYRIVGKRFENTVVDSFDESLPIDHCGHTPFGVSKAAADLYFQEYGINFGMKTAAFRGGCLTGKNSRAIELHGFLPYIVKCALGEKPYTIYGNGNIVRDQIHSTDVATALFEFIKKPKASQAGFFGQAYNLGGERENSVSIFETIDAIKEKTGKRLKFAEAKERESDHLWWISNMGKFKQDYPNWKKAKDLDYIFNEIIQYHIEKLGLKKRLQNENYFAEQNWQK